MIIKAFLKYSKLMLRRINQKFRVREDLSVNSEVAILNAITTPFSTAISLRLQDFFDWECFQVGSVTCTLNVKVLPTPGMLLRVS